MAGSQRPPSRVPDAVEGAAIILRRPAPPQRRTPLKGKRRSLKRGRRISAGARVPRARAHPRRPRHGAPTVFTRCDRYFHGAGGRHVVHLHQHGMHYGGAGTRPCHCARRVAGFPELQVRDASSEATQGRACLLCVAAPPWLPPQGLKGPSTRQPQALQNGDMNPLVLRGEVIQQDNACFLLISVHGSRVDCFYKHVTHFDSFCWRTVIPQGSIQPPRAGTVYYTYII